MKRAPINPFLKVFLKPRVRRRFDAERRADFSLFDFDYVSRVLRRTPSVFFEKTGAEMALQLFREAARRVPAYKDFLKKHGVKLSQIKTIEDFRSLPITDKTNYLKAYPMEDLCWDGRLEDMTLFSVSSGSSGKPFFWPRGDNLELETSLVHGMILKEIFGVDRIPTLFINSFSMGIYVAGVIILNSALRASERGFPLTIVSPGVELEDVVRVADELGAHYSQVILAGYPPFVKDIIDGGYHRGLRWNRMRMKFLFAAENFSEAFRDYIFRATGVKDAIHSSVSIYGSADASILGHETPFTVSLRRAAKNSRELFTQLFGKASSMPTFVQYNPVLKYFEEAEGELVFSTYGGIPLVRYNIHDRGRILRFDDACNLAAVRRLRVPLRQKQTSWKLPFLQVFGKSDFTISFYGLKIYPENIKQVLESKELARVASGRFVMEVKNRASQDQYWEINVELKEGIRPRLTLKKKIKDIIVHMLRKKNLEYGRLYAAIGRKADPTVRLSPKGEKGYFDARSVKQRWARKE